MKKFTIAVLFLACSLMVACGGTDGGATTTPPSRTPLPTETPLSTETPLPTEEPASTEIPEDDSDFPPGTRLSTVDPLAANGENGIILLANVGDALVVGVEPGVGQDVALGLFYLTGSGPGELAAQVNASPGFESLVYTFQVAGAYRLAIRELNGVSGEYALRIASSPGVALTIAPHHQVEGKLEGEPSVGYLHNGYAGQQVTFSVEPAPGYSALDLSLTVVALSDMGTVILTVNENGPGQGEVATLVPPSDDEYYITVRGESGSKGVFRLSMSE